jgi:hypothetical protein
MNKKHRYIVGVDPGVTTGYSIWDRQEKKLIQVSSMPIHRVMEDLWHKHEADILGQIFVRVEDARKRKWFGKSGPEKLQGAGSIRRDSKIWEDFLTDLGVDFELVAPKNSITKIDAKKFKQITKWEGQTNEHSRDSAFLCLNF